MHGIGLSLLGLVAGYWVLERAEANKTHLKRVGRVIGWLVIMASFLGTVCRVYCLATNTYCPLDGKDSWKHQRPFHSHQPPEGAPSGEADRD